MACAKYGEDGICGSEVDTCLGGDFEDLDDTNTTYEWMCLGENGGKDAFCSKVIQETYNWSCQKETKGTCRNRTKEECEKFAGSAEDGICWSKSWIINNGIESLVWVFKVDDDACGYCGSRYFYNVQSQGSSNSSQEHYPAIGSDLQLKPGCLEVADKIDVAACLGQSDACVAADLETVESSSKQKLCLDSNGNAVHERFCANAKDISCAEYEPKTFKVTFKPNGNKIDQKDGDITLTCDDYGNGCSITAPEIQGIDETRTVIGFSTEYDKHENEWTPKTEKTITKDITYYAQTKKDKTINIEYSKDKGSVESISSRGESKSVTLYNGINQTHEFTIPKCFPKEGYKDCKFYEKGYNIDDILYNPETTHSFDENKQLIAIAEPVHHFPCKGDFPDNAELWDESALPTNDGTKYEYLNADLQIGHEACKFRCKEGFYWNGEGCSKYKRSCNGGCAPENDYYVLEGLDVECYTLGQVECERSPLCKREEDRAPTCMKNIDECNDQNSRDLSLDCYVENWICEQMPERPTCNGHSQMKSYCPETYERDKNKKTCVAKAKFCATKIIDRYNLQSNEICFGEEYVIGFETMTSIKKDTKRSDTYIKSSQLVRINGVVHKEKLFMNKENPHPNNDALMIQYDDPETPNICKYKPWVSDVINDYDKFISNGCRLEPNEWGGDDGYYLTCDKITQTANPCYTMEKSPL